MPEHQMGAIEYWNMNHKKDANTDWIAKPSIFAHWAIDLFPPAGSVLDLGAGQGQDSRFFAQRGYAVTMTDISTVALDIAKQKLADSVQPRVTILNHDLATALPFTDASFEIVYSHLAIQYFDEKTTHMIFDEIYRVLKPGGIIACLVNSIHDPDYRAGTEVAPGLILIKGIYKRYFSSTTILPFINRFLVLVLDENGETHADRGASNNKNLVRFVGKK
jgi:ubiquinone/menaquinone biosynthesis C-methylase UbiE